MSVNIMRGLMVLSATMALARKGIPEHLVIQSERNTERPQPDIRTTPGTEPSCCHILRGISRSEDRKTTIYLKVALAAAIQIIRNQCPVTDAFRIYLSNCGHIQDRCRGISCFEKWFSPLVILKCLLRRTSSS